MGILRNLPAVGPPEFCSADALGVTGHPGMTLSGVDASTTLGRAAASRPPPPAARNFLRLNDRRESSIDTLVTSTRRKQRAKLYAQAKKNEPGKSFFVHACRSREHFALAG
jgi:hypothetical protein